MTHEEHKARHVMIHALLDELVADFIGCTGGRPSQTKVIDLLTWSHDQMENPAPFSQHSKYVGEALRNSIAPSTRIAEEQALEKERAANKAKFEANNIHFCEESVHGVFKTCGRFARYVARTPNGPVYLCDHHAHNFPVELVTAIIQETGPREKPQFPEGAVPLKGQFSGPGVSVWASA